MTTPPVQMLSNGKPFPVVWLALWIVALVPTWLLPNHYPPWPTFQSDAWISVIFLLAFFTVLLRSAGQFSWNLPMVITLALVPIPMLHHAFGLVPFAGQAWVGMTYLLGLALAMHVGSTWEIERPCQAMDAISIAIGIAGVLSVSVQLIQWTAVGPGWLAENGSIGWRIWIVDLGGGRPYANLAQPNLLGTLLLWSLIAVAWGIYRKILGPISSLLLALTLLFGIALTQSRTAWIGVTVLVVASWYWSHLWEARWIPILVSALGAAFAAVAAFFVSYWHVTETSKALHISLERFQPGLRPSAWALFMDAALEKPWFGYGWNQSMVAHLARAEIHPPLRAIFGNAHNLPLDLVIWCGIPLGLSLSILMMVWFARRLRAANDAGTAIRLLFLAVLAIHAMLEFPFAYAFFLLPAGVVVGTLCPITIKTNATWGRAALGGIGLGTTLLLGVIIHDYLWRIEPNFLAMRFENARVGNLPIADAPKVILLTHLRERLRLARFVPRGDMSNEEIAWVLDVGKTSPVIGNLHKLAWTLGANGQTQEATIWLSKIKSVVAPDHWAYIATALRNAAKTDPALAKVQFPSLSP